MPYSDIFKNDANDPDDEMEGLEELTEDADTAKNTKKGRKGGKKPKILTDTVLWETMIQHIKESGMASLLGWLAVTDETGAKHLKPETPHFKRGTAVLALQALYRALLAGGYF